MRVLAYFALVYLLTLLFRELPLVGGLFSVPLFGFFLTAILLSTVGARGARWFSQRATLSRELRELGVVDTPQMRGKLGRLLLQTGRPREALEPLGEALAADEDNLEWGYRLGTAQRLAGNPEEAIRLLSRVTELDERYAYGELWIQLALAHQDRGDHGAAVTALETLERLQGRTAEQSYRLGCSLKALGKKEEARAVFERLPDLVKEAPRYQKAEASRFLMRSYLARF